jgi:hypothetical protein
MKMLKKFFPSVPENIEIFFVEAFDLGKAYDETRDTARQIVKKAQNMPHYDTRFMRKCLDVDWRYLKDRIITMHLNML